MECSIDVHVSNDGKLLNVEHTLTSCSEHVQEVCDEHGILGVFIPLSSFF